MGLDILFGGLTGLIGTALTEILKYKNKKMEFEHDLKMVALETAAMKEEARMQIAITKAEIEGEIELADAQAYKESLKSGQTPIFSELWIDRLFSVQGKFGRFFAIPVAVLIATGFAFVDWLRAFMRPVLTIYLTGMSTIITWMAWEIMQKNSVVMSTQEAIGIYTEATSIVIYLTVSCVTWWFGDRTMAKAAVRRMESQNMGMDNRMNDRMISR